MRDSVLERHWTEGDILPDQLMDILKSSSETNKSDSCESDTTDAGLVSDWGDDDL